MGQRLTQDLLVKKINRGERSFQGTIFEEPIFLEKLPENALKLDFTGSEFQSSLHIHNWRTGFAKLILQQIECNGDVSIAWTDVKEIDFSRAQIIGNMILTGVSCGLMNMTGFSSDGLFTRHLTGSKLLLDGMRIQLRSWSLGEFQEISGRPRNLGEILDISAETALQKV